MASQRLKLSTVLYSVTSIFAVGGGFLNHIGPPVRFSHFITSPAQVIVLVTGLLVLYSRDRISTKTKFFVLPLLVLLLIGSIYYYYDQYGTYVKTLGSKDSTVVIGSVLTADVIRTCGNSLPDYAGCEVYYLKLSSKRNDIGVEQIWTPESILKNELRLIAVYWFISLTFAIGIFLVTDSSEEKKEGDEKDKDKDKDPSPTPG